MSSILKELESQINHHQTNVNGTSLHYVTGGLENGPVCVLLHGFPQNWLTWRYVIPKLLTTHKVIAIDLKGYGESDKPSDMESYDTSIVASEIFELLQHLKIKQALIVGHDRGARIARRLASDSPDVVAGLIFIDVLPTEYVYGELSAADAATKYWHWTFQVVNGLPEELIKGKEDIYLKFLLSRGDGLFELLQSDGSWEAYLKSWMQPGAVLGALNDYRATYHIDLPRYEIEATSKRMLDKKTLILWGEQGNLHSLPVLDVWKRSITNITGHQISGCGHYIPEEKPDEVANHIIKFSKSIEWSG
ncbi:alpha/beta fold hydrolase [Alkalicoccobacillus murimartini]|uniref:Pimeloyl-ACP methyl ester carboxylesterase n=1 Tax=Alkalicoccobacillus murimartini TaxID=171685 RepID=A0ABT9YFJ7_9BACI|nr:alpha/beta hydrolase [Alkalicoccobacillus murimartini]MDQ0206629.1 pimeloyl-ACP methyl ester carboxylesterase [Alkalicoccobacillus murimartini]